MHMHRYNRLVDSSPRCDIDRSDVVSKPSEAARLTSEIVSGRAVTFRRVSTGRTRLGRMLWIYEHNWHAEQFRLVDDVSLQHIKTPGVFVATLSLPNRCSPDALEVLKSDRAESVFGLHDYMPGDAMVDIPGQSLHPAGELLEMPFSRPGTHALEPGSERIKPLSGLQKLLAAVYLAIRINSEILDSEINTEHTLGLVGSLLWSFNDNSKIEHTVSEYQICLATNPIHPSFLVVTDPDGDELPAFKRCQRDGLKSLPGEYALIVNNRAIMPELWLNRSVSLVCLNNLGDRSDSELCRETESLPNVVVNCLMDYVLVCLPDGVRYFRDVVTCLIEAVHSLQKDPVLLIVWSEPDHQSLKHCIEGYVRIVFECSDAYGWGTLLPALKDGVSATPTPQEVL